VASAADRIPGTLPRMELAYAIGCVFVAALCQSATGFGFALVVVPLLALVWDVKASVALSVIVGPISAVPAVVELRHDARYRLVFVLLAGSTAGAPLGTLLLATADPTVLRVAVAAVIAFSTVVTVVGVRLREPRRPLLAGLLVGGVSGVLRSATSMGGPPVSLYLLGLRYPPRAFVATNSVYYLLGSVVAIAALLLARQAPAEVLTVGLAAVPALALGTYTGRWLRMRLPERVFRAFVVVMLLATSAVVLAPILVRR
jgi:uncharacterized protein